MGNATSGQFALRFTTENLDTVRNAMKGLGADGAQSFQQLGQASGKAANDVDKLQQAAGRKEMTGLRDETKNITPEMRALGVAVEGVQDKFHEWAGEIPIVGKALQALGPWGLAAAAAIGAAVIAVDQLWEQTRKTMEQYSALRAQAETLNLGVEQFQALQDAAISAEVPVDSLQTMLMSLERNAAQAAEGQGKLYSALKDLDPELLKQLTHAKSSQEQLDILSHATEETSDQTKKLQLAFAAFGKQGAAGVRLLEELGGSLDNTTQRFREMGLIVDDETIKGVSEMNVQFELASKLIDNQFRAAFIGFAPILVGLATDFRDLTLGVSDFIESFKPIEERNYHALEMREQELLQKQAQIQIEESTFQMGAKIAAQNRKAAGKATEDFFDALFGDQIAAKAADFKTRMAAVNTELAQVRDTMQSLKHDSTTPGLGSGNAIDPAAAAKAEAEAARKAAEAQRLHEKAVKDAADAMALLGDYSGLVAIKAKDLGKAWLDGDISLKNAQASLKAYHDQVAGVTEATKKNAEVQARWASIIDGTKSPVDRLHDQLSQLDDEFLSGYGTIDQYNAAVASLQNQMYGAGLKSMQEWEASLESAHKSTLEVTLATETLDSVLNENIKTWQDFGRVVINVFADIVKQAIAAQAKLGAQSWGQFFAGVVGNIVGTGVSTPTPGSSFGDNAGDFLGAVGGGGGAGGGGGGLATGGAQIIPFPSGGASTTNVIIRDETGAKIETEKAPNSAGGFDISVHIRKEVGAALAGGAFDTPMMGRYGLPPQTQRRV